jgi:hypothetical protein
LLDIFRLLRFAFLALPELEAIDGLMGLRLATGDGAADCYLSNSTSQQLNPAALLHRTGVRLDGSNELVRTHR